jgi:exosortase
MAPSAPAAELGPTPASAKARAPWIPVLWFFVLFCLPYFSILSVMVQEWFSSEDMGHGIFVPVLAGYLAWQRKDEIFDPTSPPKPNWWGLLLVGWGFFQAIVGTLGADFFVARTAFLVSLVGGILTLGGMGTVRKLAFPIFLLLFMIRIPLFIYSQITFPLQLFASEMAAITLSTIGIPVLREGNVLELASQKLSVVEACSGIRSLISLSFLSIVYGYFFERKTWLRVLLLVASIPIAIVCNATRVTVTGILSQYRKEFAEGIYHSLEGWALFMLALAILLLFHQLVNRVYTKLHVRKLRVSS